RRYSGKILSLGIREKLRRSFWRNATQREDRERRRLADLQEAMRSVHRAVGGFRQRFVHGTEHREVRLALARSRDDIGLRMSGNSDEPILAEQLAGGACAD